MSARGPGANWRRGDLAECVETGDLRVERPRVYIAKGGRYLRKGARYAVLGVLGAPGDELVLDLGLRTGPKLARRFRKVPPAAGGKADARKVPVSPVVPGELTPA